MSGWFGQWAGDTTGDWFGAGATPEPTQRFYGAGSWNKDWAKVYGPEKGWIVKPKGKKKRKLKTAEAALGVALSAPVETLEFAGVDLVAEFRALIARNRDEKTMRANMAAQLAALEMHAARIARERDDEEALLLLLH